MDADAALRHAAGQTPALARVIRLFVETYANGVPALLDSTDTADERRVRWRTACHSIRGALSAIGVVRLLANLDELEADLTRSEGSASGSASTAERAVELHDELRRLVAALDGIC